MRGSRPETTGAARTADPYRDTEVIDANAPRANQSVVAVVAGLGAVFGWPLAWALMSAQLVIGLAVGRRWCLPCLAYFELIQPRIGEGPLEDARPPRLANQIGAVFLGAAALAWWLGAPVVGVVLGAIVTGLALLAATTGFCAGCELYRLTARLRGVRPGRAERLDPADIGGIEGPEAIVHFTHPLCAECREWSERLAVDGAAVRTVDVSRTPELAHKYGIAVVPTVLAVAGDGTVTRRLAP